MEPEDRSVQLKKKGRRGAFVIDTVGARLAELVFSTDPEGVVVLEHTEVSESLRGQGIARKLVESAVAWARANDVKLLPVCPFAKAVFDREPQFGDVRA